MATLKDLANELGMSKRAVRARIDALSDLLEAYQSRGKNNKLVFTHEALIILRRLEELRLEEGIPIREAAERVRGEAISLLESEQGQSDVHATLIMEYLQEKLREVVIERDAWCDLATSLQSVLPKNLQWMGKTAPPSAGDPCLN
ncbi:hypothetical protein JW848_09680 [Candidatus Bipolaricaulota bacterium]|nr:hypothetical protein [Candidatus Bipolaricaulota bacterium]